MDRTTFSCSTLLGFIASVIRVRVRVRVRIRDRVSYIRVKNYRVNAT